MTRDTIVIIWLSLQLIVSSWFWMKAEKKLSYMEGQKDIYTWQSEAENGVCGPYEKPH